MGIFQTIVEKEIIVMPTANEAGQKEPKVAQSIFAIADW